MKTTKLGVWLRGGAPPLEPASKGRGRGSGVEPLPKNPQVMGRGCGSAQNIHRFDLQRYIRQTPGKVMWTLVPNIGGEEVSVPRIPDPCCVSLSSPRRAADPSALLPSARSAVLDHGLVGTLRLNPRLWTSLAHTEVLEDEIQDLFGSPSTCEVA